MKVKICVGTTCHLMGASTLIDVFEKFDDRIKKNYSLEYATCFSACQGHYKPPVIKINDELYENMSPENFKSILITKLERGE
ncbi:MAG: NAD(P)H-dependent oxidoreductase subunit E [Fusobacteriaceae bacterium]|jgi:NADH:ubiquinone oxidoreductase subunit E|nr:NAD(P)H-dependent oxidoreductase subunit E [Fusobacteriaceae bacterium]MBN2838148.1 NAD(P)H-dependent oxidoreductase subunit E [Fusobacteriaceae bacterium]